MDADNNINVEKKPKVKKTVTRKIVPDKKAKIYKDQSGNEHLVVLDEKTFYTFTNRRPGMLFFTRENSKEDCFEGYETKDDITEKEKNILLKSLDYQNGWLVEELEEASKDIPKNSYNDNILEKMIDTKEISEIKKYIRELTSEFALSRFRDLLVKKDAPSSLLALCDFRLKELEEEYLKEKEAPPDSYNKKSLVNNKEI